MMTMFPGKLSAGPQGRNRRLGWALALLTILYLSAVIAFIVAY
jgi:hypothetical protein